MACETIYCRASAVLYIVKRPGEEIFMRNYLFIVPVLLAGLLPGCTSQQDYMASLQSYTGMREGELIEKRGVPTNVYEVDGRKYLSYVSHKQTYTDTGIYGATTGRGGVFGTGLSSGPGSYQVSECENTFVIYNGYVEKAGYRGYCF
jgi:hypothetical protein